MYIYTYICISKLNDVVLDKRQRDQSQFSPKKVSRKRKTNLIWDIIFAFTSIGWIVLQINQSIQVYKKIFHVSQNVNRAIKRKD